MALVSPGVEVTIIDQSQYLPAASNSVPLVLLATATNKANAAGTGVAAATTAANANKLYQVTSQRDLVNLFGTPFFYKTTNGTPIQGYELNEYGLLAAYSLLGTTNRCFILRADIDLGSLVGTLSRPVGDPEDGQYWLDTTNSTWGIYQFNASTGKFTNQTPLVIVDSEYIVSGIPTEAVGTIGSYAVIPLEITDDDYAVGTYFYKTYTNAWVRVGSSAWKLALATATGTVSNPAFASTAEFTISINGAYTRAVSIAGGDTVDDIVNTINGLNIAYLQARNLEGKLVVSYGSPEINQYIAFTNTTGTPLTTLGITASTPYYTPDVSYGTSAQMPLWTTGQLYPHPTGSLWIKTSIAGAGSDYMVSQYNAGTDVWASLEVSKFQTPGIATATLDSSGGKTIPAGTLIGTVGETDNYATNSTVVLWKRKTTGEMSVVGVETTVSITNGGILVIVPSTPGVGETTVLSPYNLTLNAGDDATDVVTKWLALDIPYTDIGLTTTGAIEITHTLGGDIFLTDFYSTGISNGIIDDMGFGSSNPDTDYLLQANYRNQSAVQSAVAPAGGTGAVFDIINRGDFYEINVVTPGSGYSVNDLITIPGASLGGATSANNLVISVQAVTGGGIDNVAYYSGTPRINYSTILSNWDLLEYVSNEGAPATTPLNNTNWFYSTASQVDIMVQKNGNWIGYKTTNFDTNGHPITTGSNATDPLGPIISATAPELQTDGTALVYGDLWLDTSDLENYPKLSRWQLADGVDQWVAIDNTDQTSENGILFADARWATSGSVDPVSDPIPTILSLLSSNYLDLDAPDSALYPQGMLLLNTRRSGYNVKQFRTNYFTAANYPDEVLPTYSYTWVSSSGLQSNGAAYMGRKAQRNMVVQAMKAAVGTNQTVREEDTFFNLISAPNYPELQPDMVVLNNDRNNTAYIIGDTPLRLEDQATALTNWANNVAGATATGEDGWVTRDTYLGVFYPSGISTDLTGASVVVPASHMMLRTFLRNDTIAYPWFAPAGTRRGTIDNATNIGYLSATTGEFVTVKNRMSIRDVLYTNQINPLAYFTGVGLLNYGNKNSFDSQSALDRINVARLVCYIRERLQVAARPFVFEPNDALTRSEIQGVVQSLFIDLVAKRGLYDYLVVCDESNNTPARIDRNELWIDVAIEPVKAAEFIYIPVRVLNTGELAAG
jgi:hypothetical protein